MAKPTLEAYKEAEVTAAREQSRRGFMIHLYITLVVWAVLIAVNVFIASEFPWAIFPITGMTIGLLAHWYFGVVHAVEDGDRGDRGGEVDRVEVVADAAADEGLYGAVAQHELVGQEEVGDRGQGDHSAEADRIERGGGPERELTTSGVPHQHVPVLYVDQVRERVERRTDVSGRDVGLPGHTPVLEGGDRPAEVGQGGT